MGLLSPPESAFAHEAYTAEQVTERLAVWREHLLEVRSGQTNTVLTLTEVRRNLDRWLDELSELRGR